jgi:hypothetical protein
VNPKNIVPTLDSIVQNFMIDTSSSLG